MHGVVDPLNYYFLPIPRNTANATRFYGDDETGQSKYVFGSPLASMNLTAWLQKSMKAVNNVVSIYVTDYLPLNATRLEEGHYRIDDANIVTLEETAGVLEQDVFLIRSQEDMTRDLPDLQIPIGNFFSILDEPTPKLRYAPYTIIELSDGRGNVMNYKPEGFLNRNGDLTLRVMGGITHQNTVSYGLQGYYGGISRASLLDHSIINTDPQDLPVLTSNTASYLQGSKNSMQAKRNTWGSHQLFQELGATNRMGTSAGNLLGGAVGLGMNALNIGYGINMLSTGMGNLIQGGLDHIQAGQDYQNKINEQNAVLEDLANVPPSLQKQGNNPSFNIGYNLQGVRIRIKRVAPQYLARTREYFRMFGTKVNRLKQPNLRTRTSFNYVQTTMLNVQSPIYNDDILRFKYIFDQGITLWHTNDIYNYSQTNAIR